MIRTLITVVLCLGIALADAEEDFKKAKEACSAGDYQKVAKLYQKACEGGNARGCYNLGVVYIYGQGVKQDFFKAAEFYQKACEGGEARGCVDLGVMYEFGEGVQQDKIKAKEYYGKACDMKNNDGCENYARLNQAGY